MKACGLAALVALLSLAGFAEALPVTWDAGGGDNYWTTALNWSDDTAPGSGNDYTVDNGGYVSRGPNGGATFAGDSLAVKNGATLELYRSSGGGYPMSTYTIPNLSIQDATLKSVGGFGGFQNRLVNQATFTGNNSISVGEGTGYTAYLHLDGGITGSGSIDYASPQSSYSGIGRILHLKGDNSAYSGNWTVRKSTGSTTSRYVGLWVHGPTGWGTGNLALGNSGALTNSSGVFVHAGTSSVTMASNAQMNLGSQWSDLRVQDFTIGTNPVADGSYTAGQLAALGYGGTFSGAGSLIVGGLKQGYTVTVEAVADSYIREDNKNTNYGTGTGMATYHQWYSSTNSMKGYAKFDLSALDLDGLHPDRDKPATLIFTCSSWWGGGSGSMVGVHVLKAGFTPGPGELGTDWGETAITWNNALANNDDKYFDATLMPKLGQFWSSTGNTYTLTLARLGDYLQHDGTVTVGFSSDNPGGWNRGAWIATREHGSYSGPRLSFTLTPEPGTMGLLALGGLGLWRRRRKR